MLPAVQGYPVGVSRRFPPLRDGISIASYFRKMRNASGEAQVEILPKAVLRIPVGEILHYMLYL
jgi:hypothetical protein